MNYRNEGNIRRIKHKILYVFSISVEIIDYFVKYVIHCPLYVPYHQDPQQQQPQVLIDRVILPSIGDFQLKNISGYSVRNLDIWRYGENI